MKNIILYVIIANLTSIKFLYSQDTFPKDIYITTEIPNKFRFGDDSVVFYIKKNFHVYKKTDKNETVVVKFIVERDGKNSNLTFVSENSTLLKEDVLKMFDNLPRWEPGIQSGKPVRSIRLLLFKCSNGELVLPPYETPKFKR